MNYVSARHNNHQSLSSSFIEQEAAHKHESKREIYTHENIKEYE